jgi:hypothetical protein
MVTPVVTVSHHGQPTPNTAIVVEDTHSLTLSGQVRGSVQGAERLCNEDRVQIEKGFHFSYAPILAERARNVKGKTGFFMRNPKNSLPHLP